MVHVIADKNGVKKWRIPVSWEVYDTIEVQAETLEKALEWVNENIDKIPLGTESEYAECSYQIDADLVEEVMLY